VLTYIINFITSTDSLILNTWKITSKLFSDNNKIEVSSAVNLWINIFMWMVKHIKSYLKNTLSEENAADCAILKPTTHQPKLAEMCKNTKPQVSHSVYQHANWLLEA